MKFPPLRLREALKLGGLTPREVAARTWTKLNENELMTRAAAVSFYAMLACVPFLALMLTVLIQLLPDLTGQTGERGIGNMSVEELHRTLRSLFPKEAYQVAADQIKRLQDQMRHRPPVLLLASGLAVTLWLASSLYTAIIDAMNKIHGVRETRSFLKIRLTAIVMTLIQAIILVGSLVAIVAWPQIIEWMGMSEPAALVATVVQWLVVTFAVMLSFALAFYVGPDADQHWEWITPGSLAGTVIFVLVSLGFRAYVQDFANYDKTYGPLGGVMILMFWFWISSVILLSAAQMNKLIEEASPLGKNYGQKTDTTVAPDFQAMAPDPAPR